MRLTAIETNELIELIRNLHWGFVREQLGSKFVPKSVIKVLDEFGVRKDQINSYPSMSFNFGLLSVALSDKKAKGLSFAELKKFIKSKKWIPLTAAEKYGLELIENKMVSDITGLGNKIGNDLKTILIEKDLSQRHEFEKIIKNKTRDVFSTREGVQQLVSEIGHATGDWARDLGRISDFNLHEAYDNGRAFGFIRLNDGKAEETYVYKNVYNKACDSCRRLYLDYVRKEDKYKPKIFKLSELLANGTNIGKKQADWKAVVGATHPWCRCDIEMVSKGTEYNFKKEQFVDVRSEAAKRLDLRKFIKII